MRDRAFRRYQEEKKKIWVKKTFPKFYYHGLTDRNVGIRAHTPHPCSCHICGNARAKWKQKTLQEIKFDIYYHEEMLDEEITSNYIQENDKEWGPGR